MSVVEKGRERLTEWRSTYKCKYCSYVYDRKKPNCPRCKTRRGAKGRTPPVGGLM